ncbi:MAG: hypothetical protein ABFR53_00215 [Actinomycetota bacterium]
MLRRWGFYDDPTMFNALTVAEVAGWRNTGPVIIANLSTTATAAIRKHLREAEQRARVALDHRVVASEPWSEQI